MWWLANPPIDRGIFTLHMDPLYFFKLKCIFYICCPPPKPKPPQGRFPGSSAPQIPIVAFFVKDSCTGCGSRDCVFTIGGKQKVWWARFVTGWQRWARLPWVGFFFLFGSTLNSALKRTTRKHWKIFQWKTPTSCSTPTNLNSLLDRSHDSFKFHYNQIRGNH